jgi:DNA-binding beta-propeller fold protein YncE
MAAPTKESFMVYQLARWAGSARLIALIVIALSVMPPESTGARPNRDPTIPLEEAAAEPLPGGCGRVTPPGAPEPTCCISGVVIMDGAAIAGAEVEISSARGARLAMFTQVYDASEPRPYYRFSLSAAPLNIQAGETIRITARYSSHERTIDYVVRPGGQQVDLVLARRHADDYMYGGMIAGETEPGLFKGPVAAAADGAGNVYVLDRDARLVQVFGGDGQLRHRWGSYGNSAGQFVTPTDIAADAYGNVYIADRGASRVQKFTSAGVYLTGWQIDAANPHRALLGRIALGPGGEVYLTDQSNASVHVFSSAGVWLRSWQLAAGAVAASPQGIAVARDGSVFVVDQANQRIQKFSSAGRWLVEWGAAGSANGQFDAPQQIALDPQGNVFVADTGNQRVQKFSPDGRWLAAWGRQGSANGQFDAPQGIAVAADSAVYVADTKNQRVQKFNPDGRWLAVWGGGATLDRTFNTLGGVDTDAQGNVYVTDTGNHRVQKFTADGRWLATWGRQGSANGQLSLPRGIVVAADGSIYVADTGNHRIQKFAADGRWLAAWGRQGSADGQFNRPCGLGLDASGNLYVADTNNHRIQKFAPDGRWLAAWGRQGSANGQLQGPRDVEVDASGNLYIVDTGNHRVQKFAPDGRWLAAWGRQGGADGEFFGPKGIALDAEANVYVADTGNYRLQKFAPDGRWLAAWGRQGSADGRMQELKDITVDPRGAVLAADTWVYNESNLAPYSWVYSRLQVFRPMQHAAPVATINYLPRLSLTRADTLTATGLGQSSEIGAAIQAYHWTSDRDGLLSTDAALRYPAARLSPGTHRLSLQVQDSMGRWSAAVSAHILVSAAAEPGWTMLLYLAGDYQDQGSQLNAFQQTLDQLTTQPGNPLVRIAVQLDGPADGDTQRMLITPGSVSAPPTVQRFAVGELAMDDPATLANFVSWGQQKFPADSYYLSIADHGQAIQGIAWDHTSDPSGGAYLTAREIGQALQDPDVDTIDVLHLDSWSPRNIWAGISSPTMSTSTPWARPPRRAAWRAASPPATPSAPSRSRRPTRSPRSISSASSRPWPRSIHSPPSLPPTSPIARSGALRFSSSGRRRRNSRATAIW